MIRKTVIPTSQIAGIPEFLNPIRCFAFILHVFARNADKHWDFEGEGFLPHRSTIFLDNAKIQSGSPLL